MYFRLRADVFLTRGARAAMLYDLGRRRTVWLNDTEKAILEACERGMDIQAVVERWGSAAMQCLDRCEAEAVGERWDRPVHAERYSHIAQVLVPGLSEPPPLFSVAYLQLTGACNLQCRGCGREGLPVWQGCSGCDVWSGVSRAATMGEADVEGVLSALEPLDVRSVLITGGNPLLVDGVVWHALRRMRNWGNNPRLVLVTNGSGLSREWASTLKSLRTQVALVALGRSHAEYEGACGHGAAFEELLSAATLCRETGVDFTLSFRLTESQVVDIEAMRGWAAQLGARRAMFLEPVRIGERGQPRRLHGVASETTRRTPVVGVPEYFSRAVRHPCLGGALAIAADRTVRPCPMIGEQIGDLKVEPLHRILSQRRHERFWKLTKEGVPTCRVCEYRVGCMDCAAIDLRKADHPALARILCSYDPLEARWGQDTSA